MQAYIYTITPFDATKGTVVHYSWNGTQTNVAIQIKNSSGTQVYNGSVHTNLKQISIPADRLENGKTYTAYITITDSSNRINDNADVGVQFLCRKTPIFEFEWEGSNVKETNDVYYLNAYSFNFNVKYVQEDGERLSSWQMNLYSSDRVLLSTSGVIYNPVYTETDGVVTSNLSYQFSGFGDRGTYYVRAQGKTQNGIIVDTIVEISSNYTSRSIFSMLKAENVPEDGRIYIKSDIISSVCKVYDADNIEVPEEDLKSRGLLLNGQYIDPQTNSIVEGDHALILPDGYYMVIDEGFRLGTFSNALIFINPVINVPLLSYSNSNGTQTINLYYRVGKFAVDWKQSGVPEDGSTVIVRYQDTEHGGYHYGWQTYNGGWGDVTVRYENESGEYYDAPATWADGNPDAWGYSNNDYGCFELVVDGTVHDRYVSNTITKAAKDEKIGVVIVRDDVGRYDVKAYNGFNLSIPKESYATSEGENVG